MNQVVHSSSVITKEMEFQQKKIFLPTLEIPVYSDGEGLADRRGDTHLYETCPNTTDRMLNRLAGESEQQRSFEIPKRNRTIDMINEEIETAKEFKPKSNELQPQIEKVEQDNEKKEEDLSMIKLEIVIPETNNNDDEILPA